MAFTLSNLLESAYRALGRTKTFLATGGSATTIIATSLAEKLLESDVADNAFFISTTTDALTPQGKFGLVTSYVEDTTTFTIPTVTDVVGAGDLITLVDGQFPLYEMISLANSALSYLGDLVLIDTSLTTADDQTEYAIPVAVKRDKPVKVQISTDTDTNSYQWKTLQPSTYEIVPATGGSTGLLIFRDELPSGYTLKIWYSAPHPDVSVYSSVISEYIHPELAKCSLVLKALEWINSQTAGSNDYWVQRQNAAQRDFEIAMDRYRIWKQKRVNPILVIGSNSSEEITVS